MKPFPTCILLLLTSCQVVKTVKTETEQFPDGKIKTIRQTVIKKNRDFELHDNFREEKKITREYYHNGKPRFYWKVVYTNGSDASCYESSYKLEQYDSTGVKRLLLESECDCQKKKEITYNEKGKVLKVEKTVIKRVE